MRVARWVVLGALTQLGCRGEAPPPQPPHAAAPEVATATANEVAAPSEDAAGAGQIAAEDGAGDGASHDAASGDTQAPAVAGPKPSITIELLEAGTAPHNPLRYALGAKTEQHSALNLHPGLELGAHGQHMPNPLPMLRLVLDTKVTAADAQGAQLELAITEAQLEGGVDTPETRASDRLAAVARSLRGLRGTRQLDARGLGSALALATPPDGSNAATTAAVDGFLRGIDDMTVVLPAEAVGVGAKWRVVEPIEERGLALVKTRTFELVERKGTRAVLRYTAQLAPAAGLQTITFAGGMRAVAEKAEGHGEGTLTLDLRRPLPLEVTAKSRLEMTVRIGEGDSARSVDVALTLIVANAPPPPKPNDEPR